MADFADITQHHLEQADHQREQQRLERMRSELRGLNISDCEDCGEAIPEERKQRIPTATRCVPCQEAHELRLRTQGRGR